MNDIYQEPVTNTYETEWTVSKENPGYREKIVRQGNCSIVILRPILTKEEQAKRERKVADELARGLRDYLLRTAPKETEGKQYA